MQKIDGIVINVVEEYDKDFDMEMTVEGNSVLLRINASKFFHVLLNKDVYLGVLNKILTERNLEHLSSMDNMQRK